MRVVAYTLEHKDELRAVCIASASERARTDEIHGRFTLLMYCDPYLDHGTAFMLLDDDGVARGYILCAENIATWKPAFAPYFEQIKTLSPEYEARVQEELDFYESVADRFPAHLHIDIQEEFTGGGNGRKLIEALLATLREHHVLGVVFGVAASNERAVGFYRHMGFEQLSEYDEGAGYTFCMSFA